MKSNFLNEELEKEVYVDQAPSNVMKEKKRQGLLTSQGSLRFKISTMGMKHQD
jgi:hypothetical protein